MGAAVIQPGKDPSDRISSAAPANVDRREMANLIAAVTFGVIGIATISLVVFSIIRPSLQVILLTLTELFAWLLCGAALIRQIRQTTFRVTLLILAVSVMMFGMSVFVEGQTIMTAFIALIYTVILTSVAVSGVAAERSLTLGVFGAWLISLTGLIAPLEKFVLPGADLFFPSLLGVFAMAYATLLAMEYVTASLRLRLTLSSLALVILPLLAVSLIQSLLVQGSISQRIQESLSSASSQTAFRVDEFLSSNRDTITRDATIPILADYLLKQNPAGSQEEKDLQIIFDALQKRAQPNLLSYGILDSTGTVRYDINPEEIGRQEASTGYYAEAVRGNVFISDLIYSEIDNQPYLFFSSPIFKTSRTPVGILRAKYDARVFQTILKDNINLVGPGTSPILLDTHLIRLGDMFRQDDLFKSLAPFSTTDTMLLRSNRQITPDESQPIATDLEDLAKTITNNPGINYFTGSLSSSNDVRHFVAVTRLVNKPWLVLYTQDASMLTRLSADQQRTTTVIASILAGFVALLTTIFAQALTRPITRLTTTAQRITDGDLSVSAPVSNDEIGLLANSFNIMTARLRQFINELEERVRARTSELAERNEALTFRSRQIQTIAEVARSIAAAQELETLLNEVTALISSRFGFYHVGVFLVDETREYAVLRAANSEGGKRMLARQHKLRIGQVGIVGYTTGSGMPRIATDVGTDAVYFNNPDLPATRSEMALPLIGGGEVIGALDVQSTQSNAFSEEDIELFATLADQVSVAILNSRAFEDSQRALAEAQLVHQQYLHQEWSKELKDKMHLAYEYTQSGVTARDRVLTPEIENILATGQALVQNAGANGETGQDAVLGIPIKLRGEIIGIIHLQDQGSSSREWAVEEIETVQSVADQVAQALENARLFEQTVRRAERERKVLEITSKIRSTNDPQTMLQIAVDELQRALRASKAQVILNADQAIPTHSDQSGSNGNGRTEGK
jgi:GAF domain-containing protein/HAMP domain-containing protein